ncbi:MAG: hypothetical protein AB8H80_23865 [Planctomycetota bacterium]
MQNAVSLSIGALACRVSALLLAGGLAAQTTFFVDANAAPPGNGSAGSPFPVIASALAVANTGDTVRVFPGTYIETLQLINKSVDLESIAGPDVTIIDGGAAGTVLEIAGWAAPVNPHVTGFTLTNGNGQISTLSRGTGGLDINQANVTLTDCNIVNNVAGLGSTGGIRSSGGNLTMVRCEVRDNIGGDTPATKNGLLGRGGTGGVRFQGLTPTNPVSLTMTDCLIRGNRGGSGANWIFWGGVGGAGGLDVWSSGTGPTPSSLTNCRVVDNTGGDGDAIGGSGGLNAERAGVRLLHCTVAGNTGGTSVTLGAGGLRVAFLGAFADVTNSILWGNATAPGAASQIEVVSSTATVSFSDIEGGYAGTGNLQLDPAFRDAANGDYRLTASSPCMDAGDSTVPDLPATDFEGDPRLVAGDVDMGVDEACLLGTDEGFSLKSLVNGLGNAESCRKVVAPGGVVELTIPPPAAALVGKVGIGFLQFYATGTPGPAAPLGLATLHVNPTGPQTIYYSIAPISAAGSSLTTQIPALLSGVTIRVQYVAISTTANNGVFAATSAHDIEIL